jgi:hypothetical protein
MFVTCVVGFSLGGGKDVYPGTTFEMKPQDAQFKIARGIVREATPEEVAEFVEKRRKSRAATAAAAAEDDLDVTEESGEAGKGNVQKKK